MLVSDLLQPNSLVVDAQDAPLFVLQMMEDNDMQHLPVVQEGKYIGLVAKHNLYDDEERNAVCIGALQDKFLNCFVRPNDFFLRPLTLFVSHHLSLVPVINDAQELVGVVTSHAFLQHTSLLLGTAEAAGTIVLEMNSNQYSFAEINRLV